MKLKKAVEKAVGPPPDPDAAGAASLNRGKVIERAVVGELEALRLQNHHENKLVAGRS
jgi:hypothetical protein